MAYEKRVAVLKQVNKGFSADGGTLSGAVYAERLGNELKLKVQTAGLAALREGRYAVVFKAGEEEFCLALGGGEPLTVSDAPSIKDGFGVLIAFVKEEAQPVAFGRCGKSTASVKELLDALTASEKRKGGMPAIPVPPVEFPPVAPNVPRAPTVPLPGIPPEEDQPSDGASFREGAVSYDDEAIAERDYFFERVREGDRNEDAAGESKDKKRKKKGGDDTEKDDNAVHPFLGTQGKLTYYKKVKDALDKAFQKFPQDTRLLKVFPRSEWVRTENALLGIVYENGKPRYLCVAAEKKGDPPEEMKDRCAFVPESPFSEEKGFFIVFQDADTGAYVTVSES